MGACAPPPVFLQKVYKAVASGLSRHVFAPRGFHPPTSSLQCLQTYISVWLRLWDKGRLVATGERSWPTIRSGPTKAPPWGASKVHALKRWDWCVFPSFFKTQRKRKAQEVCAHVVLSRGGIFRAHRGSLVHAGSSAITTFTNTQEKIRPFARPDRTTHTALWLPYFKLTKLANLGWIINSKQLPRDRVIKCFFIDYIYIYIHNMGKGLGVFKLNSFCSL